MSNSYTNRSAAQTFGQTPPEPQAGGRYRREADGSLALVDQTQEGRRRTHPDHVAAGTEQVAAGAGRAMTPAPQGATATGDGTGTALPPVSSTKNSKE
jgi:hypothetical protein